MNKIKIKKISLCAIFTAIIAACAWISVPTPFGINLTMQLFGVCLAVFILDVKGAVAATAAYIAIGAVGIPVFSSFTGGLGVLFGASGGFIWGFLIICLMCGISRKITKKTIKYTLMVLSVLLCHMAGIIQFCVVTATGIWAAFLSASLPFLLKDIILVFLAQIIAKKIKI